MEDDAPESIQKIGTKLASTLKGNTQEALQNVAEKTREVIQNPSEALESTKSAVKNNWKVITLVIVMALIIWFLIYMFRPNNKKNANSVLNHSNVYRMWEFAPIGTTSAFQTMSEDLPATEDEMTYIMNLYIEDWNGTPTTGHRELFHHGPSQCCEIKDEDVINVQFDHTKNDLYIHVRTELNCGEIPYKNAKQLASTKDYLFVLAEKANGDTDDNYIFIQKLDGSSCWEELKLTFFDTTFKTDYGSFDRTSYNIHGIDVITYPKESGIEDDIYIMVIKKDGEKSHYVNKLNVKNNVPESEFPEYEASALTTGGDINEFTGDANPEANHGTFSANILNENEIVLGYGTHRRILNRDTGKIQTMSSYNNTIDSLNNTELLGINTSNKVFYCIPSSEGVDDNSICSQIGYQEKADTSELEVSSISTDDSKIWAIDSYGKKIYSTNNISSGEWNLRKQLSSDSGDTSNDVLSNIHASPHSKHRIWSLYNQDGSGNIVIPLSKSTSVNINSGLELDSRPATKETVTIQNIPIGNPFQLAITITKKTVEVYINGKLYGTKVLKGTRPDDNSVKALRFFGTQSKINGTIHNFIFAPFPVSIASIQSIAITEKPGSVKKESLFQKCTSYFF